MALKLFLVFFALMGFSYCGFSAETSKEESDPTQINFDSLSCSQDDQDKAGVQARECIAECRKKDPDGTNEKVKEQYSQCRSIFMAYQKKCEESKATSPISEDESVTPKPSKKAKFLIHDDYAAGFNCNTKCTRKLAESFTSAKAQSEEGVKALQECFALCLVSPWKHYNQKGKWDEIKRPWDHVKNFMTVFINKKSTEVSDSVYEKLSPESAKETLMSPIFVEMSKIAAKDPDSFFAAFVKKLVDLVSDPNQSDCLAFRGKVNEVSNYLPPEIVQVILDYISPDSLDRARFLAKVLERQNPRLTPDQLERVKSGQMCWQLAGRLAWFDGKFIDDQFRKIAGDPENADYSLIMSALIKPGITNLEGKVSELFDGVPDGEKVQFMEKFTRKLIECVQYIHNNFNDVFDECFVLQTDGFKKKLWETIKKLLPEDVYFNFIKTVQRESEWGCKFAEHLVSKAFLYGKDKERYKSVLPLSDSEKRKIRAVSTCEDLKIALDKREASEKKEKPVKAEKTNRRRG